MKEFIVNITPIKGGEFITSFNHPLTRKIVRKRFKIRIEAKTYAEDMERKFKKTSVESYQNLTIEELFLLFFQENPRSDLAYNKKSLVVDFIETFGEFSLDEITTDSMKVWLDQIQKERNLKNNTMRSTKCSIDRFFTFLIEKDIISESPVTTIYYAKVQPNLKMKNLHSEVEIDKLLTALKNYSPGYLYPLIKTFAETGAKTTEVTELTWSDLDLTNGVLYFKRTASSQERKMKISDELLEILKKKKKSHGFIFLTYYGEPFAKNKMRRAFDDFKAKKLYGREWCPMDLRHSFAVNFLKQGRGLKDLQYILGHSNVFDTKRIYGEVAIKKLSEILNPLLDLETGINPQ